MKHPYTPKLACDVPFLHGLDLRFIGQYTWPDFKMSDRGDNLTFDEIKRINVTHYKTMPVGFCSVTFLNKQINYP